MKPHFKTLATALATAVLGGCMPASAAVPLRWTVETSRAQPASFDVYRGETLNLSADMLSYGKPLAMTGDAQLFYQTNNMAGWWTAPATISSNRISAVFAPSMDPGAQQLYCFLGVTGSIYRASFRLRFNNAPGAEPANLPLPPLNIDFSRVTVDNAPWIPQSNGSATALTVGNVLNVTDWMVVDFSKLTDAYDEDSILDRLNSKVSLNGSIQDIYSPLRFHAQDLPSTWQYIFYAGVQFSSETPTYFSGPVRIGNNYLESSNGSLSLDGHRLAVDSEVAAVPSIAQAVTNLSATVNAWQTYWDGDGVRVTVTNYYGSLDIPSLYLEQRMPADGDHAEPWFRTVWDERTRWEDFLATNNLWKADVTADLEQKADRAWGHYDSHTGGWSPDGYTQVSSSNILIAAGMAYQRHVVHEGAVWLLESNGLVTNLGGDADSGYFKIQDDDGNAMFEIVKGNRREVGATANSVVAATVNGTTHLTATYNVVSAEHPKLYTAHDLGNTFVAEDDASSPVTVNWTGSSGAWVCEFYYKASVQDKSRLFSKAGYTIGGETMIRQSVPVEMGSIILNGTKYYLGTATISGHTVLTLRTTP